MIPCPKGTRDYLPADMAKRRLVMEKIRKIFERYGYSEICTPAFESLELFEKKGGLGEDNIKDIYRFQDKSERWLALRFEMTASIARVITNNPELAKPIKMYYIANMWRYEATKKGRLREFWQAGVENFGKKDELADAEVLAIAYDSLKTIGIENFIMKVNSRKLISKIADKYGINDKPEFFRLIDKKEKLAENDWKAELGKFFKSKTDEEEFLKMTKKSWAELKKELASIAKEDIEYLEKILEYCKSFGVDKKNIEIDISLIRGLDYYTDFIFETTISGEKDLGSIAGGGRYDNMIETFGGQPTPATGMAIGIERVMEILNEKIKTESPIEILILPIEEGFKSKAIEIATELRKNGIKCDIEITRDKFKKKMTYASDLGVKYILIIGKEEIEKGIYTLKDMTNGEQKSLSIGKLIEKIRK